MKIISVRENPEFKIQAIQYIQEKWASESSMMVYEDCILSGIDTKSPLPMTKGTL